MDSLVCEICGEFLVNGHCIACHGLMKTALSMILDNAEPKKGARGAPQNVYYAKEMHVHVQ